MAPKTHRDGKKKGGRQEANSKKARSATAGAQRKIVHPNVDADGEKLPAPVAALLRAIDPAPLSGTTTTSPGDDAANAAVRAGLTSSSSLLEVEVETKQGYLLNGVLVALDAFYNVTLQDATSRRARVCDIERALMREKIERTARALNDPFSPAYGARGASTVMDEATEALLEEYRERPDSRARPRYVGTTVVRSSNLLMIRFLPSTTAASSAPTASTVPLAQRFSSMATSVKKVLALQKLHNRRERRQRLEEAKKKRSGS